MARTARAGAALGAVALFAVTGLGLGAVLPTRLGTRSVRDEEAA